MAMEVQGSRRHHDDAGVKVKFIETQFISSDAASFKAVVQRLTGKSPAASASPPQMPAPQPQRPRPCRPAFGAAGYQHHPAAAAARWPDQHAAAHSHLMAVPAPKQEPRRVFEDMNNELCDFADLFYTATAGAWRDGAGAGATAFPY